MSDQIIREDGTTIDLLDFDAITPKSTVGFNYIANGSNVGQDRSIPEKDVRNPISIKSPLAISERFGAFDMSESIIDAVKDQLKNIILTNKGERVGNYNFGADVQRIIFESNIINIEEEVARSIQSNVSTYCPGVTLLNLSIFTTEQIEQIRPNEILLRITFAIEAIDVRNSVNLIIGE